MNINDQVQVTLTDDGVRVYENSGTRLRLTPPTLPEDRILKTELWDLMHVFGPHICMGSSPFFVHNEVTIIEEI